jgi:hypothetical protein
MGLQVIGAGLPRTGTRSLRAALETLLGGSCYHMSTLFERDHEAEIPRWQDAVDDKPVDWDLLFTGCTAAVDWPASAFWSDISARYPDALVILSTRDDAATWWRSADATVWPELRNTDRTENLEWFAMVRSLARRVFGDDWEDAQTAMTTYDRYNAGVRATCPPDRLVDWQAQQGWGPLCEALGVPVPDEPFPRLNTSEEWAEAAAKAAADKDET